MFYSWRAFVPTSMAWKDWLDVWSGEKSIKSLFFYGVETPEPTPEQAAEEYLKKLREAAQPS